MRIIWNPGRLYHIYPEGVDENHQSNSVRLCGRRAISRKLTAGRDSRSETATASTQPYSTPCSYTRGPRDLRAQCPCRPGLQDRFDKAGLPRA